MPKPWPNSCPPDLRRELESVLGWRSHGPAEIWGAMKEWAERHGVEPPAELPGEGSPETRLDQ
jgi:hypothetical protein